MVKQENRNGFSDKLWATLIFSISCVMLTGCPNPSSRPLVNIKFYEGAKVKKNHRVKIADGNCYLTVSGTTLRKNHDYFKLYIEAQYRGASSSDFKFRTNALKVISNGEELIYPTGDRIHVPAKNKRKDFVSPFVNSEYYLIHTNKNLAGSKIADLKIVLDNFVFYKGDAIAIDTIEICCL